MSLRRSLRLTAGTGPAHGTSESFHSITQNTSADESDDLLTEPFVTPKKIRPPKIPKTQHSLQTQSSLKRAVFEKDLTESHRATEQLLTPPSSVSSSQASEESLPESPLSASDYNLVTHPPVRRKRKASTNNDERITPRLRTQGTYQKLSTSKKELKLIDAVGSSKTEENGDDSYKSGSYSSGIWVKVGLPREGLRRRGPAPKEEKKKFTNRHNFAFNHDPFPKHKIPSTKTYKKVLDTLVNFHGRAELGLEIDQATNMPVHAGEHVTVHAIIKVIMSQATMNDNAETALASLRNHFRYGNGQNLGKTPNYHIARLCPLSELEEVVKPAGFWRKRAKAIQDILNLIYRENLEHLGLEDGTPEAIATNGQQTLEASKDFVEGLLSVDWLRNTKDMQELFDRLARFEFLGVKTIMCIIGFNLRLPCFAVDTHVYRLSDMLNWFPHKANIDKAAMHLDFHIPDEIKYELHQAFWHHGRNCIRCRGGTTEATAGYKETFCPIAKFKVKDWDYDRKVQQKDAPKQREAVGGDYVDEPDADEALGVVQATKPKPQKRRLKTPRAPKSRKLKNIDEEEMKRKGFIKLEVDISDNFGVSRPDNIGKKVVWIPGTQTITATTAVNVTAQDLLAVPSMNTQLRSIMIDLQEGRRLRFKGIFVQDGKATKVSSRFSEEVATIADGL